MAIRRGSQFTQGGDAKRGEMPAMITFDTLPNFVAEGDLENLFWVGSTGKAHLAAAGGHPPDCLRYSMCWRATVTMSAPGRARRCKRCEAWAVKQGRDPDSFPNCDG